MVVIEKSSIIASTFVSSLLKSNLRLDGRSSLEARRLSVAISSATHDNMKQETVQASLGNTKVFVTTTSQITSPLPDRSQEGIITFRTIYSLSAVDREKPTYLNVSIEEREVSLSRLVERIYKESKAIDIESLCILAGEKVFSLQFTIHIVEDDGNVEGCMSIALISALQSYRRPDVKIVGDQVTVYPIEERNPVQIGLRHTPVCVKLAVVCLPLSRNTNQTKEDALSTDDEEYFVIVDPTKLEEECCDTLILFCINGQREIVFVQKCGGIPIIEDKFIYLSQIATHQSIQILNALVKQ